MRFLQFFLSLVFSFVIIVVGGFLALREGLLFWAENRIQSDVRFLQRTNTWSAVGERCLVETGTPVENLQLRFVNDREYVLEVSCGSLTYYPWSEMRTLPWQVQKTTGSAGFVVPISDRSVSGELTLSLWGQNKLLTSNGDDLQATWGKTEIVSDSLISSCVAHGLTCCDQVHEAGVGDAFTRAVNDCQNSCYSACHRRPNLLFFQTDPPADPASRVVQLSASNTFMLFNFTFETTDVPIKEVLLDFGDGTQETFTTVTGKTTKEYVCDQPECHYTARVSAVDEQGVASPDLRINEIEIVIQ